MYKKRRVSLNRQSDLFLRTRPLTLSLLASRDERMPRERRRRGTSRTDSRSRAGVIWFRPMPLPIALTAGMLQDGLELLGDEVALSLEPRSIYALRFDDTAGGWVDVDHLRVR